MPTHVRALGPSPGDAVWHELGARMLEREWRPVALLDGDGLVIRTNHALRLMLPTAPPGNDLFSALLDDDSRGRFAVAHARMLEQGRARFTASLRRSRTPAELVLECERIGETTASLVVVVDSVEQATPDLLAPVAGLTYEIGLEGAAMNRVLRRSDAGACETDGPCWKVLFGRETKCPGCPLHKLRESARAIGVVRGAGAKLAVVHAERRSAGVATVTAFNVAGETYSAIISSRVDELAEAHALTHREREILQFLLLGRSSEEIASALGITPRTVKYHQQNLLRKLGADSRVDLTRLLL